MATYDHLVFSRPANQIKSINVPPIPTRIIDGMKPYQDAVRGFTPLGFEKVVKDTQGNDTAPHILLSHRPGNSQVEQIFRIPVDHHSQGLEQLTHFNTGTGRKILRFLPIAGDDWRGPWRAGGAIVVMDISGNENFQLWRYWEDSLCETTIPQIDGELDNRPGVGRIERITHDDFRNSNIIVSRSNKILAYTSNKANKTDTLVYISRLINSNTGSKADTTPFTLPSILVTPAAGNGTTRWSIESISIDDRYILLTKWNSTAHRPFYIVDISGEQPTRPHQIVLPDATEAEEETAHWYTKFSQDPTTPHIVYLLTNAYSDFKSVVMYDISTGLATHITTPVSGLRPFRAIPWETDNLIVSSEGLFFTANVEGWDRQYVMPVSGEHKNTVLEIKLDWEGGSIHLRTNDLNKKPNEIIAKLVSYRSQGSVHRVGLAEALQHVETDNSGNSYINVTLLEYKQAAAPLPPFRTLPPKLLRFKSFDGLEISNMYYHPTESRSVVPLVINIHGGPESQATSQSRIPIHWYLLNELGCAVIYPNVRGSSGYGKRFLAADEVEKREDSVKDIGALLNHVATEMKNELDAGRIAVMGGSYGGYMTYACLTHYSSKLACGLANFGIAHWPDFLTNTAPQRRAHRRRKYGDESDPQVRAFLESISPLNHAEKITVPLSIAHGETDSRVTVEEAIKMWSIVNGRGVHAELMVCEKEGHGFKQKSVIEFTNAAKLLFLERFLLRRSNL